MGGRAFKNIETPRLSKEQYDRLQAKVQAILELHFEGVATPIRDPDKTTHGDVDYIVHTPLQNATIEYIGQVLGAKDVIVGKPTANYAVPFEGIYAQVDVHRCEKHEHPLRLFINSYGRLGHVLSAMLLRFGLFFDKRGLWFGKPMPATPTYLLSKDLAEILELLHLDYPVYNAGFRSRSQLFEWMEAGRIGEIPLIRGWRGATAKPGDAFLEQWAARRAGEPKIAIDKEEIQTHLLAVSGKKGDYDVWRVELERKAEKEAKEKARSEAIRAEVTRRLEGSTAKGKAIKEQANRIRAEVEASFPPVEV